eukprot:TCONS_00062095-protein
MAGYESNRDSVNDFWFAPVKFINLKHEVVNNRGKIRHYHSVARCKIQILSLEQQRMVKNFQKKLSQSEKIILQTEQTRDRIERKRYSMVAKRHENNEEMKIARAKSFEDNLVRLKTPPWKSQPRAKTTPANVRVNTQTTQRNTRSKSRETIRKTKDRFDDGARTVFASFPRIKEAWVVNASDLTSHTYLKRFEKNLTEETYTRHNLQLYQLK